MHDKLRVFVSRFSQPFCSGESRVNYSVKQENTESFSIFLNRLTSVKNLPGIVHLCICSIEKDRNYVFQVSLLFCISYCFDTNLDSLKFDLAKLQDSARLDVGTFTSSEDLR